MVCTRARAKILGKHQHPTPQMANEFQEPKQVREEDERLSPQTLPPASFPLETQILPLSPQTPGINFMDSSQNRHLQENVLESSSVTLPLEFTPPSFSQENISSGAKVLYKDPLKTETRSKSLRISNNYWNKKKLETLSHNFNPIPFSPKKWPLDISTHQVLLTRLGLWDFLNLDFDQNIRTDLIKELVAFYNPKRFYYCRSVVRGMPIVMGRDVVEKALFLPGKRSDHNAIGDGEGGNFVVSQEEASFLEELIWGYLVLKDDDSEVIDDYELNFTRSIEEMRYEVVDWAGLIWFMLERELLRGQNLVSCYYASHLQLLLKYQRPELFDDHVDKVGSTGIETEAGDVKMLQLENFPFDEKMEKESCNNVVKDTIGLEATENEQKKRNILVMCRKRRGEYFDKRMKEKNLCIEENNMPTEVENLSKRQSGADLGDERFGNEQQMQEENQDQHQPVILYEGEDENKRGRLTDLKCVGIDYQSVDLPWKVGGIDEVQECSTFMDSIMNHQTREEGLKDEGSFDLICSRMDDLNVEEMKNQLSDLISNEQNGEASLGGSEEKVEDAVAGKISFADEQFDTDMEHGSKELIVVHGKKEGEVLEVLVNESECKSEAVDSLGTREEELRNIQVDLNAEKQATDNDIALNEEGSQERRVYDSSNSGEGKVEPKVNHVDDFQNGVGVGVGVGVEIIQVTLNALYGNVGSDCVQERKEEEGIDLDRRGLRLVDREYQNGVGVGMESMQVTLNALHGNVGSNCVEERKEEEDRDLDCRGLWLVDREKEDNVKEDKANEAECATNTGNLLEVCCKKEDVMEYKPNEAECGANTGNLLEVHCEEEDVMEDKANEAKFEGNAGNLLEVHCEKEDVMKDKENEAEFGVNTGNLLEVHCEKEYVMEDKRNEAECKGNIGDLLEVHSEKEDDVMEDEENEAECETSTGNLLEVYCKKEDVMEDKALEAECGAKTGNLLEMHCVKEEMIEDKENEAEFEGNTGNLFEVHCEKEYVMEDKRNEAECKGNSGDLLEVHSEKEDDVMEDEANEADCLANIGNSLEVHCKKEDDVMENEDNETECKALEKEPENVQDQQPLELQFKNESEKKRSSLNDLARNEMDYQEVDSNSARDNSVKELESSTSMDLRIQEFHEKGLKREGSAALVSGRMDDFDRQEMDNKHVHLVSHQENTAKIFSLESTREEVEQKIHIPDDRVAMDVDHDDNEMRAMEIEKEEDMMKTLANKEARLGDLLESEEKEFHKVDSITEMHNACSDGYDEGSMDIDFCSGQVEVWMARLKNATRRKDQLDSLINGKLLKKLEEQRQIIQHYERMRQKEQQQKQKDVRKYERELQLMKNILQEYRKALKEVHNSFSRYRERRQLPDEPVYMDHPSGGGRLIPVAKWKKLEQQRVISLVKKFEHEWISKLQGHLDSFDSFCDKLENLEFAVRELKSNVVATGYGTQKASHA